MTGSRIYIEFFLRPCVFSCVKDSNNDTKHNTCIIKQCNNKEISHVEERKENGKKIWSCSCHDNSEFKIQYSSMYMLFNGFEEDAWFESFRC